MILRFMTIGPDKRPRYIAINTAMQVYTQGAEAAVYKPEYISPEAYSYILGELNFHEWDYTDDIYIKPDLDDLPAF